MKKLILLFAVTITLFTVNAQNNYAVSEIDTSLTRNANVVVRFEEDRYELKSLEKAVQSYKRAITILNEKGDKHAGMYVSYDMLHVLDYFEGSLYDAQGKKIRSLKKGEVKDFSAGDGISLANDGRYKQHSFYHRVYPYTVEYEYSVINKQTMFFPSWFTQVSENYAVQESRFTVIVPKEYKFRYKAFNYSAQPEVSTQSDKSVYQWAVKKLPAVDVNFGFPGWRHVSPMVITAPSDFQIGNYKGNLEGWDEFGKFVLTLNEGRDVLPDPIRQQVQALVNGKNSNAEKVEALYNFLQKNTRYISIQFGVGGWQPFEAAYVAKNRYGDCKALSNYMYSLLKEAGIPSYYTLIRAGEDEEDIVYDFPSRQFNHAILCVPLEKDSIWLECTSQDQVPGYMGSFTGNRHAVIVTPEGGKLVRTPSYGIKENQQVRWVKAYVDKDGNVNLSQQAKYSGMQQDIYHAIMNNLSKDKLKEFLNNYIDLPTFDILEFNYNQERKRIPVVNEQLKLSVSNYAQVSGKRIFVAPNINSRENQKLPKEDRKYPIWVKDAHVELDSVEIFVPDGYTPEAVPASLSIESKFGKYQGDYKVENNKIIYYRRLEFYNGMFDKSLYGELVKFYEQIYKGDRSRVVLVKNE